MVIKNLNSSEVPSSDICARIEFKVIDEHDDGKDSRPDCFSLKYGTLQ